MFCKTCGAQIPDDAIRCSQCGSNPHDEPAQPEEKIIHIPVGEQYRSRTLAGILQILPCLIGVGGIGRLYLGHMRLGFIQFAVAVLTVGMASIWSLVDGILILTGMVNTDAQGKPLK